MSNAIIQANYDTLDAIAARFGQQAEATTALQGSVVRSYQALEDGGWEGRGFAAFSSEMQGEIFPALQRLNHALEEARAVTLEASAIIRQAEEEAARLFQGGEYGGVVGDGSEGDDNTWGAIGGIIGAGIIGAGIVSAGIIGGGLVVGSTVALGWAVATTQELPSIPSEVSAAVSATADTMELLSKTDGIKGAHLFKGFGDALGVAGYALDIYEIATGEDKLKETAGVVGSSVGGWVGFEVGAFTGAYIGTFFGPGYGTVIGGVVGGFIGGFIGNLAGEQLGEDIYGWVKDWFD